MKNEYKGHKYTHKVRIKIITNEIFACAHLSNLLSGDGDRGGKGDIKTFKLVSLIEIQSNFTISLHMASIEN